MTETPPLFDEPERIDLWTAYPKQLVQDSHFYEGIRWLLVGEDGQFIVFLGHPDADRLIFTARFGCGKWDHDVTPADLERTWARFLTHCPDHLADHICGCQWCEGIDVDDWWLDWSTPDGQPLDHHASTPGYFPVTIWEVIQ